ncbi:MAG TPA: alpha/beta fold hydrolase [Solirubrobacteraceae bacterium]|jgi:pimeloyl-ACP methyl ester carboxylesterase
MRSALGKLAIAFLAAFAVLGALALSASAQIAFKPCGNSNNFACGHVTVPLDPTGLTPGTINLAVRRHRATVGEAHSAIVALAGGPGQPALPFAEDFAETLGSIAATRDLIVFDQRGIGLSHPLSCHAFENPSIYKTSGAVTAACADQLGPTRSFYTSANTVADIEAIRVAGGYEKLVLYGTSYGTKVAEEYAQTYPEHVEALVLDSVVPPNGPDPLHKSTFAAVPRVLRQLCVDRLCAHITPEPVADLAKVVRKMHGGALSGEVLDGKGQPHKVRFNSNSLLSILVASDFSPRVRAEFIPYVRAVANGDTAPLARLFVDASSGEEGGSEDDDNPLFYATTCEEQQFPWNRAVSPHARLAEAVQHIKSLGPAASAPFTAANMLAFGSLEECASWPFTSPNPPPVQGSLPNVPTLILSGTNDLRTPTANAQEVAAAIPDAHLLVVPYAGHSVLGDEPTTCGSDALKALFAARAVKPCAAAPPPPLLRPPPLPPLRLAQVPPAKGNAGKAGRTLEAVVLTLSDFTRQLSFQLGATLNSGSLSSLGSIQIGGLRSGSVRFDGKGYVFHDYSFVPNITLSGRISSDKLELRIGGSAAARGKVKLGAHHSLTGTLGGHHVHILPSIGASAAIVGSDARASHHVGPGGSAARAAVSELTRPLRWLLGA